MVVAAIDEMINKSAVSEMFATRWSGASKVDMECEKDGRAVVVRRERREQA